MRDTRFRLLPYFFRILLPLLHSLYLCYHWAKISLIWSSIALLANLTQLPSSQDGRSGNTQSHFAVNWYGLGDTCNVCLCLCLLLLPHILLFMIIIILSFITAASVFNSASNPKPPEKNCDSFYNYGCHAILCSRVEVKYEWLKPTKWCYRRVIDAVLVVSCRRTDIIFDMFLCSLPLKSTLISLGFFQSVQHWCMKIPRWSTAE